jgi:hypothetical protein
VSEVVGLESALYFDRYTAILQKMEQMAELRKAMQERMETQIGSEASKMDASQAEMKIMQKKKTDGWRANNARRRATGRKVKPSTVLG